MSMKLKKNDVLSYLRDEAGHPVHLKEIMRHFAVPKEKRKSLKSFMQEMTDDGEVVRIRGDRYGVPAKMNLVVGRVQGHADGFAFVIPDEGGDDVYVNRRNLRDAMHGDHVVVRVERSRREGKREGSIIRIIERVNRNIVGRYEKGKNFGYVVPGEEKIAHDIYIPKGMDGGADAGDIVLAEITAYPAGGRNPEGRVLRTLGCPDDPDVEVESILLKYSIPFEFPAGVIQSTQRIPESVIPGDTKNRVDLRGMKTVTIDGETAKDFDDAVSVKMETDGNIRLWVSIADVGHYVKEGSPLDREARKRGTSVYFPDRCIPMLPERLSNGICSLNPGVDRLTLTVEMLFDERGECLEKDFYPSVIRSDFRLTYTIVKKIVVDSDEALEKEYQSVVSELRVMQELCRRLKDFRNRRGCIDFDLPEAQIILDIQGGTEAIVRSERNEAHMIIEEFMLAANEAVASFLTERHIPMLYRVHEKPDAEKIRDFREFIYNFGYTLKSDIPAPKELQKLLNDVSGRSEERTINHVLLRSMKQAVYSSKNIGHFGLASEKYCHFTSPIRRYPDLMVHRILKEAAKKGGIDRAAMPSLSEALSAAGEDLSLKERRAMEAERDIIDLKKVQFMRDKVGEKYFGFITGVTSFGFFVELEELFVEGLVHVTSLDDDYYHYDEKGHSLTGERMKRRFRIGEELEVLVESVDVERRRIDFRLV